MKSELTIKKIYQGKGEVPKKYPERPVLSAIDICEHSPLPDEELKAIQPQKEDVLKRMEIKQTLIVQKKLEEQKRVEKFFGKQANIKEEKESIYSEARKQFKKESPQVLIELDLMPPCRFRKITIKECLTKICTDQKEFVPVLGNYNYLVCEPLNINAGEFPSFSITDCVPGDGNYSQSEGWINVGGSFRVNLPTKIKEIGFNFEGSVGIDVDGEDHSWPFSDEWGRTKVWSVFKIRSKPSGGSYSHLISGSQQEILEKNEYNGSGPTNGYYYVPNTRKKNLSMDVNTGHEFIIDYWIKWEVERSDDYWSSACFWINNLKIKPYVIYETCHWEYREVARFFRSILPLSIERAKMQGLPYQL